MEMCLWLFDPKDEVELCVILRSECQPFEQKC